MQILLVLKYFSSKTRKNFSKIGVLAANACDETQVT